MYAVGSFIKHMGTKYQDFNPLEAGTESSIAGFSGFANYTNQLQTILEVYGIDDVSGVDHWFEEIDQGFFSSSKFTVAFRQSLA